MVIKMQVHSVKAAAVILGAAGVVHTMVKYDLFYGPTP